MNKFFPACSALLCATGAQAAIIDTYQVGTGLNTSTVQVDFQNGNGYLFEVSWQGAGTTGWDLMVTMTLVTVASETLCLRWNKRWSN